MDGVLRTEYYGVLCRGRQAVSRKAGRRQTEQTGRQQAEQTQRTGRAGRAGIASRQSGRQAGIYSVRSTPHMS